MTTLEWNETQNGYASGGYLITRTPGESRWALRLDASLSPPARRPQGNTRSFPSLRSARAAALHLEVVRIRRIKLIRHIALSITVFALSIAFYSTMMAGTVANRLEWFALAGIALVVSLSEALDAFVLVVADGWDHRYEVPSVTVTDRIVSSMIVSTLWPKVRRAPESQQMVKVRPLT